jgi:molecular chaperone DnaK (HSP70)
MAGYRAAVDFGTSYTVAASMAGSAGAPTVVALVDEGRLASAVALDDAAVLQAGPYVEEVAALAPDRVERTPKRCLDQPDIMLGGQPVLTVDLVAAVLGYVRDELLRQFNGADPGELCLTHPARWEAGDSRMLRLQAASLQAGFPACSLLPEPCAAALALAAAGRLAEVREGGLVAVYDLGGGTFDLALLSRAPDGGFVLVGEPGGDPELGGEWLDDRLLERLSGQLPADDEASLRDPDNSADPLRWRRAGYAFRQGIRRAKERLAREASTRIALNPPFTMDHLTLSRAELERTATPLITRSADRFDLFLTRNGKTPGDLAAICLVGGSSRLTVVNRVLGQRFGRPIATHGDPKSITALGPLSPAAHTIPADAKKATRVLSTISATASRTNSSAPPPGTHAAAVVPGDPPSGRVSVSPSAGSAHPDTKADAVAREATRAAGLTVAATGRDQATRIYRRPERKPADAVPPAADGVTSSGARPRRRSRRKTWLLGGGAAAAVILIIIIIVAVTSSGSTVTPGHTTPQAAVAGYYQSLLNGNYSKTNGFCSYVDPAVQNRCVSNLKGVGKGSGNFSVDGAVAQGSKALVEVTGSLTPPKGGPRISNSNATSGMPQSPAQFDSVYNRLLGSSAISLSPTLCIKIGGAWYVV